MFPNPSPGVFHRMGTIRCLSHQRFLLFIEYAYYELIFSILIFYFTRAEIKMLTVNSINNSLQENFIYLNKKFAVWLYGAGDGNRTHVVCLEGRNNSHYTTPA